MFSVLLRIIVEIFIAKLKTSGNIRKVLSGRSIDLFFNVLSEFFPILLEYKIYKRKPLLDDRFGNLPFVHIIPSRSWGVQVG